MSWDKTVGGDGDSTRRVCRRCATGSSRLSKARSHAMALFKIDHVLSIAAGAFHNRRRPPFILEIQGRLPIPLVAIIDLKMIFAIPDRAAKRSDTSALRPTERRSPLNFGEDGLKVVAIDCHDGQSTNRRYRGATIGETIMGDECRHISFGSPWT